MLYPIVSLKRNVSWVTTPMSARSESTVTLRRSWPSMVTRPSETSWNLGRSSMSVDFPAPDMPTNATSSPLRMRG
jgi:hypothetical protein